MTSRILELARSISPETIAAIPKAKKPDRRGQIWQPDPAVTQAIRDYVDAGNYGHGSQKAFCISRGIPASTFKMRLTRMLDRCEKQGLTISQLLDQMQEKATATGHEPRKASAAS